MTNRLKLGLIVIAVIVIYVLVAIRYIQEEDTEPKWRKVLRLVVSVIASVITSLIFNLTYYG